MAFPASFFVPAGVLPVCALGYSLSLSWGPCTGAQIPPATPFTLPEPEESIVGSMITFSFQNTSLEKILSSLIKVLGHSLSKFLQKSHLHLMLSVILNGCCMYWWPSCAQDVAGEGELSRALAAWKVPLHLHGCAG